MMQCVAVLLLEIANKPEQTEEYICQIVGDIKKLMGWLQIMQNNDPVARRAHDVVRNILHNAAPALRHKAEQLLDESLANRQAAEQEVERFDSTYTQPSDSGCARDKFSSGTWPTTGYHNYPSGETASQHQDYAPSLSAHQSMHANFPTEHYRMPSTFGNPFLNSWDEGPPVTDMHNIWPHSSFTEITLDDLSYMDLLTMAGGPQYHQGANDDSGQS